ncbi:hypothetical protein BO70DRAFT_395779 [Aspergillus heteromorphus CBS 117.55]|uniref:Zn(2)-C6 fungal-type domain-containing protein n=1 Tax=Aspergillus heteromorphus CBS 117.55 TaxID=1448321 RepID=A0A317WC35_9EURO|nr:uncharacterized protein BO70DRAFT_395779 [Aspergillus heteromorphus CBS 117.55]PWY83331.1 hypothetical protein BO70DRAFT_395779 [Aspergillus heteromorphus CBS 117.55]
MVYCGKPSKACEPCRIRRVKCDLRRPGCRQCYNTGRVCSGYRIDIDVNFRHQTDAVVQRYGGSPTSRNVPNTNTNPIPVPAAFQAVSTARTIAVRRFLSQTTEAIHGEYVLPLYERAQCAPVLTAALEAVSLACLANEQARRDLLTPAREQYGRALRHLRQGLARGHGELAALLSAGMLLAQFAGLAGSAEDRRGDSPGEWSRHVNGAFSLLATRVLQGGCPLTLPGRSLFLHLVSCLLVDCLQRGTTFSPAMRALLRARRADMPEFQLRFWGLVDRMCLLNAVPGGPSGGRVAAWQALDREVAVLMQNMPRSQAYADGPPAAAARSPDPPCPGYGSYRIAQQWNILRMVRLAVNERLIEHAPTHPPTGPDDRDQEQDQQQTADRSRAVIATMIRDICASVPRDLRPVAPGDSPPTPGPGPGLHGWAYSLVWPLSLAGKSPSCPAALRGFIARQMAALETMIGLEITTAHAPHEW